MTDGLTDGPTERPTDGPTDGLMDRPTKRGVESHSTQLKRINKNKKRYLEDENKFIMWKNKANTHKLCARLIKLLTFA